jgi:acyl carrier protein
VRSLVRKNFSTFGIKFSIKNKMDRSIIKFRENFASAIDEEEVNKIDFNTRLEDIDGWDSFAVMSTVAMLDQEYGIITNAEKISEAKTLQELYNLIVS